MKPDTHTRRTRATRAWLPYLVLFGVVSATAAIAYAVRAASLANDRLRFDNAVQRTSDAVTDRIETYVDVLRAGAGLFAADREVSREEFRRFVERIQLQQRYAGVQGVGFTARVRAAERDAFIDSVRRQGVANFTLRPEGEREEYQPVTYIEPGNARNLAALGYDMRSEGVRRETLERARDTGRPAATGRVTLVQETEARQQPGFLIYVPVYGGGTIPATVEERRATLRGFLYSPFRADDLLGSIFGTIPYPLCDMAVYDGAEERPESLIHRSDVARGEPVDESYRPRFTAEKVLDVEGRPWRVRFFTRRASDIASEGRTAPLIALTGGVFGLALFFVTRSQVRARARSAAADAEVRASENRFRTLVEQSPVSTQIFSPDGRTVRVNRAWEELWGVTLEGLAGYNILEDPQLEEKGIAPYIRRGFAGEPTQVPAILYDPEQTIPGVTRNKDPRRWVSAVIYPVKDEQGQIREVVLIHEDITERVRAEEEVRRGADRLALALDSARLGDWSWEVATDLVTMSERAAEIFGIPPGLRLTWTRMRELLYEEDRERARIAVERTAGGRSDYDIEYRVVHGDGSRVWVSARGRATYDATGRVLGMLGVLQDVTERKRTEESLREHTEAAERARLQAEEASRLKDEFLATVSHELRTPLTAVLGWSKLLKSDRFDPQSAARALEAIERNAAAQARLIDDLLDVSRVITGKLRLDVRRVELLPVIEAAAESVRPAAEARGVRLDLRLDPAAGPVSGDADRLRQVVWNLLSNAIKFTPGGGSVSVSLGREGAHAELTVADTGAGIAPEFLPHVFDRFRQADGRITRQHGGLGLGLAITRHLVEIHGGTVEAESPGHGAGATFRVRLPLLQTRNADFGSRVDEGHADSHQPAIPDPQSATLAGLHVLVVDDDDDTRELMAAVLGRAGARVTPAATAAEAFDAAERLRPDVLLADIGMPGEDGYTLIKRVRALGAEAGGDVPAAALTAYARPEDRTRALESGFQMHIAKPSDPDALTSAVAKLAGRVTKE
jgi:PAS domain S-box-containing protein